MESNNLENFEKTELINIIGNLNSELFEATEKIAFLESEKENGDNNNDQINESQKENDQLKLDLLSTQKKEEELVIENQQMKEKIKALESQINELNKLNEEIELNLKETKTKVVNVDGYDSDELVSKLKIYQLELESSKSENKKLKAELKNKEDRYISEIKRLSSSFREIDQDNELLNKNEKH